MTLVGSDRRPTSGVFITGTDTGVGKTHVALALIRGLVRDGRRVAAMKPVAAGAKWDTAATSEAVAARGATAAVRDTTAAHGATAAARDTMATHGATAAARDTTAARGETAAARGTEAAHESAAARGTSAAICQRGALRNDDALLLAAAANVAVPYETLNPYCLAPPVSPHIAAEDAGIVIDPAHICREFDKLTSLADCVVVEGAGGWLAPITRTQTMEAVALALDLPVILVVGLRLGCLNHALLTAGAVRASGLKLAHWIANEIEPRFERCAENVARLSAALGPPLAVVPHSLQPADTTIHVSL